MVTKRKSPLIIKTSSGIVRGNRKDPYSKWLQGWIKGGGFSGATTVSHAWANAQRQKTSGVSWFALGKLMSYNQRNKI